MKFSLAFVILSFFNLAVAQEKAPCPIIEAHISGHSLAPLVPHGTTAWLKSSECRTPQIKDLALFPDPAKPEQWLVKLIAGKPGDVMTVKANGKVLVNGKVVIGPDGKAYLPHTSGLKMLKLYEGPLRGWLVIGNPKTDDSSRFGLIPTEKIRAAEAWPKAKTEPAP